MSKIPCEKFIITFLLLNKDIGWIINKAKDFGYRLSAEEVKEIFDDLRDTLPSALKREVNDRIMFSIDKPEHAQWLEHFEIAEFYDFLLRKNQRLKETPPYFKWFRDIVWIHNNPDVLTIVNIFMFNGEPLDSISDVISFKYKKKIGIDAFEFHRRIFWDTDLLSAKEALYHCNHFQSNTLIIKRVQGAHIEATNLLSEDQKDGSDVAFVFHNNNYIKWKIGYPNVEVPSTSDFLNKVKTDSYYKYYEAMNMAQSVEVEHEEGTSAELGAYDRTKTKRRNVEEQRAKAAKHWMELFVKADKSIPTGSGSSVDDFFKKMDQLELDFDDADEKIVSIDDAGDILEDIKGDIQ